MTARNLLLVVGSAALAGAPIAAAATDAVRASEPITGESELASMGTRFLIGAILAAGLAILIIADDDDEPVSA
ncbi:hypothetical protein P7228_00200 [Altererythrobacter arenosus]|uniref:Uncharacterized protein n=1 Tax=Altererythrobacter arenosus TaxID=3032592 RepID=A0ABY8FR96_9SPHN|nr:hypothetical protein [Altererythrobacter sp. CAU 1644]WFL77520.1 hypothetical protein P7228_00200 [Altererythrobacter sp. CAU 1644]